MDIRIRVAGAMLATVASFALTASVASAQTSAVATYDLPAQPLADSLRAVGQLSGRQVIISTDAIAGKAAAPLHGSYGADDAIRALLAGADVAVTFSSTAVLVGSGDPVPSSAPATTADSARSEDAASEIVVTGSHVRGSAPTSFMVTLNTDQASLQGQHSLAAMAATLPQNFGGGQNPGVGVGIPGSSNISSASSIDLRGLGPDATLTLLDGHRLAYNAEKQSIDISAIPYLAVDRLEIVPDGSSALYGSDAVAGVANIILKPSYDGVLTSARIGGATDGGGFQQQYDGLAGKTWATGSIYLAYEFERDRPIDASERSYTRTASLGITLYPALQKNDAILRGSQSIGDRLTLTVEGLFNDRSSSEHYPADETGIVDYRQSGVQVSVRDRSFAVAPSLTWKAGGDWQAELTGTYGQDQTHYRNLYYFGGALVQPTIFCNCNTAESAELNANGTVLSLPAGPLKAAVGLGYRSQRFTQNNADIDASQTDYYGYGELGVPLVSRAMDVPFVRALSVDAAGRFESYRRIANVFTPKLGVSYTPIDGLDLKGSWGRSFKAPTLFQQYVTTNVVLYPAATLGGTGYPATSTAIDIQGGNTRLKPERAESWQISADMKPAALPGVKFETSYYSVDFKDRIVSPIPYLNDALSDPTYASFVELSPSAADQTAAIAKASFYNYSGAAYDPANVVAIVTSTNTNAAHQLIHGVDATLQYHVDLPGHGTLDLTGYATYIHSRQRLTALAPVEALAGTIFNPPHYRARAGGIWSSGRLSATAYVNYTGPLADTRSDPAIPIRATTTLDVSGTIRLGDAKPAGRGLTANLAISDVTNAKPPSIVTYGAYEKAYESANYSPIGRFIALTLTKGW